MSPEGPRRIFAGNQPTFLPWLGLFEQMAFADAYVICDNFQSSFPGWLNRNKIKGPRGICWLQIPIAHNHEQPIHNVEISTARNWRRKHLESIRHNYSKAPFFETYWPGIQDLYAEPCKYLSEFSIRMTRCFAAALGLEVAFLLSSEMELARRKGDRVIDLCKKTGCNAAYLAAGTRAYVKEEKFRAEGIEVIFQDYNHPVYPQQYGPFLSHLSVLDLLMNCGPKSWEVLASTSKVLRGDTQHAE